MSTLIKLNKHKYHNWIIWGELKVVVVFVFEELENQTKYQFKNIDWSVSKKYLGKLNIKHKYLIFSHIMFYRFT